MTAEDRAFQVVNDWQHLKHPMSWSKKLEQLITQAIKDAVEEDRAGDEMYLANAIADEREAIAEMAEDDWFYKGFATAIRSRK